MPRVIKPVPTRKAASQTMAAAPGFPGRAGKDQQMPKVPFMAIRIPGKKERGKFSTFDQMIFQPLRFDGRAGKGDVDDDQPAAVLYSRVDQKPLLASPKVTVRQARMQVPSTWPLSASRPEGMSMATTGRPKRIDPIDDFPKEAFTGAFKPVPKIPSTKRSVDRSFLQGFPGLGRHGEYLRAPSA